GSAVAIATKLPATGTYYALVSSDPGSIGSYNFSSASTTAAAGIPNPVASGQAITNATLDGRLGVYTITGVAGGSIVASAGTPYTNGYFSLECRIQLFGPAGQLLDDEHATSSGGSAVAIVTNAPGTGTYYIVVT